MQNMNNKTIGKYQIQEQLGEGGMAVVYKAYDNKLKREVAIKFIRLDSGEMPNRERLLHRFEREGRFLARLSHPNIVNILDVGEYRGLPFLVMEYVSAKTLKEVIREHKGHFRMKKLPIYLLRLPGHWIMPTRTIFFTGM